MTEFLWLTKNKISSGSSQNVTDPCPKEREGIWCNKGMWLGRDSVTLVAVLKVQVGQGIAV